MRIVLAAGREMPNKRAVGHHANRQLTSECYTAADACNGQANKVRLYWNGGQSLCAVNHQSLLRTRHAFGEGHSRVTPSPVFVCLAGCRNLSNYKSNTAVAPGGKECAIYLTYPTRRRCIPRSTAESAPITAKQRPVMPRIRVVYHKALERSLCNVLNLITPPKAANHLMNEPTSAALCRTRHVEWCMRGLGDGHWRPAGFRCYLWRWLRSDI
ncbi:hypothetical protein F4680DRAFT_58895 [Xylaria scruposa]|nr:hypothetical protein F4680DRAFT_58895 [Xylaria scruposa]